MTTKYLGLTVLTAALGLAACGGGGGDHGSGNASVGNTPPVNTSAQPVTPPAQPAVAASAEGVYEGTTSGGLAHFSLVTDTGRLVSIIGTVAGGVFGIARVVDGNGTSSNGTFTASDMREYGLNASPDNGTFAGTYVAGARLNGVLTMNSTLTSTLTGTALTSAAYTYAAAAKVADIAGAWTLKDLNGATVTMLIAADGSFTGTSAGTCAITGSLTPSTSGKNLFALALTTGPAPCPRPAEVTTGVAVAFTIGSTRQLIAAGSSANRVNGNGWVGAR